MLTVDINYESDPECPNDEDCQWRLYSFNSRHLNFKNPSELGFNESGDVTDRKLKAKLKNGLAHLLSYYEHGLCSWFRQDTDTPAGVEFRWDGVRTAGLLVWEHNKNEIGAKTFEDRAKDADGFLKCYTDWANGSVYYVRITDKDDEDDTIDSFTFYNHYSDESFKEIAILLHGKKFEVTGDTCFESDLRHAVKNYNPQKQEAR